MKSQILENNSIYRDFVRKKRIRSVIAILVALLFVCCLLFSNNNSLDLDKRMILIVIIALLSLFSLKSFVAAFFFKPTRGEGIVEDIRTKQRVVSRADELERRNSVIYLVAYEKGKVWCKHISSYTKKDYEEIQSGDSVLWFSYGSGERYILKK